MMGISLMFFVFMSIRLFPYRKKNNMMMILFWGIVLVALQGVKDVSLLFPIVASNTILSRIIILLDGLFIPLMGLFLFEAIAPGWVTLRRLFRFLLPVLLLTAAFVLFPSRQVLLVYLVYIVFL